MRKCMLFSLFASLVIASNIPLAISQTQSTNPSSRKSSVTAKKRASVEAPKQNLSDDFAKAGIKALRAIEGTFGMPSDQSYGRASDAIDSADAEARTEPELAVVKALHQFSFARLANNLTRKVLKPASYNAESEIKAQEELENNPRNIEMKKREAACSQVLEHILRARFYEDKPEVCYNVTPPKESAQ